MCPIKQPGFQTTPISIFFAHQKRKKQQGALHGQIEAEGAQALLAACMEDRGVLNR